MGFHLCCACSNIDHVSDFPYAIRLPFYIWYEAPEEEKNFIMQPQSHFIAKERERQ